MVNFILNDLCHPTGKVFRTGLRFQDLTLRLDGLIVLALTWVSENRQTAIIGIVCPFFLMISGLNITMYLEARSLSSRKAIMRLRTPIMLAAIPTDLSLCAINVSSKSCATCNSPFMALPTSTRGRWGPYISAKLFSYALAIIINGITAIPL